MKLRSITLMVFAAISSILGSEKAKTVEDTTAPEIHSEQCVLIRFPFAEKDLQPVFDLEEKITKAIESAGTGEFDGNEVGGGEVTLFMYGKSAKALFKSIEAVLRKETILKGGTVTERFGPPGVGAKEVKIKL